jgi:hypothetical protein
LSICQVLVIDGGILRLILGKMSFFWYNLMITKNRPK